MSVEFTPGRIGDLVLETLPSGELAWLRADLNAAIRDADRLDQDLTDTLGWPEPQPEDGPRYVVTDRGHRALAMDALFGQPWPTVAETCAEAVA